MSDTPRTNALDMHIQSDGFMDGQQRPSGYELMRDLAAIFERQNTEALALLRELNDALAIPKGFRPRVDAVLDRAEKSENTNHIICEPTGRPCEPTHLCLFPNCQGYKP